MSVRRRAGFRGSWRVVAVLLAVLACSAAVAVASSSHARVGSGQGKRGAMLVGGNGYTLYLFTADWYGKSYCYASNGCTQVWHPDYTNGNPTAIAGSGVKSSLLGTIRRKNGWLQVTYNKHPLYFYSGDTSPGDMHGENLPQFGGHWYVVGPTSGKAKKPVVFNPGSY